MTSTPHVSRSVVCVTSKVVIPMRRRTSRIISVTLGAVALSGCASLPETTRSAVSVQVPQPASITALQRRFQAEAESIVYFGFDQDVLDAEAIEDIEDQATWILAHPNVKFRVYGHTDRVGNIAYNADLGLRRANRVVDYLVSLGVEPERLEAVVSFGEDAPVVDTEDRERLNRRAVTEVHEYIKRPPVGVIEQDGATVAIFTDPAPTPTQVSGPGPSTDPDTSTDPGPSSDPDTGSDDEPSGDTGSSKNPNSGRGNGDEAGDPGKSGGKNNGGDEV